MSDEEMTRFGWRKNADGAWERPGHDALWDWFGLSYASFITLPRVLAHAMPDEWQAQMAKLLEQFDEAWPGGVDLPTPHVSARDDSNKFTSWPGWLLRYRHPDWEAIEALKQKKSC